MDLLTDTELARIHVRLGRDSALTTDQFADIERLWKEVRRLRRESNNAHVAMWEARRDAQLIDEENQRLQAWAENVLIEIESTGDYGWWHSSKADLEDCKEPKTG